MTVKKKIELQTRLSDEVPGFRIGPNGEVEIMTQAEVEAVVERAIREAMYRAGWPRLGRTLH
ncbi:hypothetical protein [Bradyrhizobium sp. AZCC 2289]|uniref:hypothetical protein n=1 Tax=Bradyrhizobium sp. AZCC 2289 TaxID=3117026 RepID=UPI002FF162F6